MSRVKTPQGAEVERLVQKCLMEVFDMIKVQETTDWGWSNHIYMLDDSKTKLLGYQVEGQRPVIFTTPMDFSTRGRKFVTLKDDPDMTNTRVVQGSKGNVYYVTNRDGVYRCTCTGFKFHGTCKHIKETESQ
jgi:hypothetical protein